MYVSSCFCSLFFLLFCYC